jgi:hypothetical protein
MSTACYESESVLSRGSNRCHRPRTLLHTVHYLGIEGASPLPDTQTQPAQRLYAAA